MFELYIYIQRMKENYTSEIQTFLSLSLSLLVHSRLFFFLIYSNKIVRVVQFGRWDFKVHSAYRNVVVSWEAVARSIPHLWESNNALKRPSNRPRLSILILSSSRFPVLLRFLSFLYCYNISLYLWSFTYCCALLLIDNNLKALFYFRH